MGWRVWGIGGLFLDPISQQMVLDNSSSLLPPTAHIGRKSNDLQSIVHRHLGVCKVKTIFPMIMNCYLPFCCVDICTRGAKQWHINSWLLSSCLGSDANLDSPVPLPHHVLTRTEMPLSLNNVPDKTGNIVNLFASWFVSPSFQHPMWGNVKFT